MRVVIAEDSVLLREGLTRLLTEAGHDVAAAESVDPVDPATAGYPGAWDDEQFEEPRAAVR